MSSIETHWEKDRLAVLHPGHHRVVGVGKKYAEHSLHHEPLLAVSQRNRGSWGKLCKKKRQEKWRIRLPADLPPILRWAFWSSKNSLVAVRSETRFSSSAILLLSWWFSSWIWSRRKNLLKSGSMLYYLWPLPCGRRVEGAPQAPLEDHPCRWGTCRCISSIVQISPSPSFRWATSPLKHTALLIIKVATTTTTITKWVRSPPWASLMSRGQWRNKKRPLPDKSSSPCHIPWHSHVWTGILLLCYKCPDNRMASRFVTQGKCNLWTLR